MKVQVTQNSTGEYSATIAELSLSATGASSQEATANVMKQVAASRGGGESPATSNTDSPSRPSENTPAKRKLAKVCWSAIGLMWASGRRQLLVVIGLQALNGLVLPAQVIIGREILSVVLRAGASQLSFSELSLPIALLFGATFVGSLAQVAGTIKQQQVAEMVTLHTQDQVIATALSVDLATFDEPTFYDELVRAQREAQSKPLMIVLSLAGLLGALVALVALAVVLLRLAPVLLALSLVAVVPLWFTSLSRSRTSYSFNFQATPTDRQRAYFWSVLTSVAPAKEIRAYGFGAFLRARHRALFEQRLDALRVTTRKQLTAGLVGSIGAAAVIASCLVVVLWLVTSDRLALSSAGAAVLALSGIAQRLQAANQYAGQLYEGALFLELFERFLNVRGASGRAAEHWPVNQQREEKSFDLENVTFTYPHAERPAVEGLSISIAPGEIVALVGENGSGKTTAAKLLGGLYRPDTGRLWWADDFSSGVAPPEARARVAIVFQDFGQYWLSISENIALGDIANRSDAERISTAAEHAGVSAFTDRLSGGIETMLGKAFAGGHELSTGQWQRIALARAYFRDAELIIMDEPTASLDPRAEHELFSSMRELFRGKSVLLISHRFSTVRMADRIHVLRHGRVVEEGSHTDLMALGGLYAELFDLQASTFKDDDEANR